ncbi:S66 peptidase family protein [Shouchella shacheensis]|uniref:S66 peptidase family protein n=1 Tax=Shouchella shacheensis TaxID=1649580 RepID=UPI0007404BAB|nr:LD-carboxypeptidase [Shouchella shacheensis]
MRGDTIGVIAPASSPSLEQVYQDKAFYEGLGLNVKPSPMLGREYGYLHGTDEERVSELEMMFADPEIAGVFCACGGYGTPRIVDQIDYDLIRENPKIFWGYSDITCLHTAIYQQANVITFHGPMLSSDLEESRKSPLYAEYLKQVMRPTRLVIDEAVQPLRTLAAGQAKGPLVGGNLSLLVSTLGTPYELDTKEKILFIEEVEEEPYRIDRMLNQLRLAGKFSDACAVLLCDFQNCLPANRRPSISLQTIFHDHVVSNGKPILSGFMIGHCKPSLSVPHGAQAEVNTLDRRLIIEPGVV